MDKKNTILLTVIAIATLLVAVVGATFAYFATTQNINANIPVNVATAGKAASFTSTVDGDINIQVDANEMQQADSTDNPDEVASGLQDTATLTVLLGAAAENQSSVCTYDVIFTWTSAKQAFTQKGTDGVEATTNAYYVRTISDITTGSGESATTTRQAIPKEFTITATSTKNKSDSTQTTTPTIAEINIDELLTAGNMGTRQIANPEYAEGNGKPATITADYMNLIKGATIESASLTNQTTVTYTFNVKFYNATHDQTIQMGKTFSGMISVNPDTIQC